MIDPTHPLLVEYMHYNPKAENPCSLTFHFGEDDIIQLLTIANNREITFRSVQLPTGEIVPDLCVPSIEGEIVEGYEPDIIGYELI